MEDKIIFRGIYCAKNGISYNNIKEFHNSSKEERENFSRQEHKRLDDIFAFIDEPDKASIVPKNFQSFIIEALLGLFHNTVWDLKVSDERKKQIQYLFTGNSERKEYTLDLPNDLLNFDNYIENNKIKQKMHIETLAVPLFMIDEYIYFRLKDENAVRKNNIIQLILDSVKAVKQFWYRDYKEDYALPCDFYKWALEKEFDIPEEIKINILDNIIKKQENIKARTGSKTDKNLHNKVKEICRLIESDLPNNTKIVKSKFLELVRKECDNQNITYNESAFRAFWKSDMPNNRKLERGKKPK